MPNSRNTYNVVEIFKHPNGREYAKVRYKGIDQTGYIARVQGPGYSITRGHYLKKKKEAEEGRYRTTLICDDATRDKYGRKTEYKLEAWLQTDNEHSLGDAMKIWNRAKRIAENEVRNHSGSMFEIQCDPGPKKEVSTEIDEKEEKPQDKGAVFTMKGRVYRIKLTTGKMEFETEL